MGDEASRARVCGDVGGKDAKPGDSGDVCRELNGEVFLEKRQSPSTGSGRAFGVFSVVVLSLCTVILYARMYRDLLQHHDRVLGPSQHIGVHTARQAAKAAARDKWRGVNLSLAQAVENVAGPTRSIIFVSASKDYLDFLENWFKSVSRFGYASRVLFIAEDEAAYAYLKNKWPAQTVLVQLSDLNLAPKLRGRQARAANSTYGSSDYNSLVDRRPEYFKALIDLRVSFLYNDVDIVWLKDPYPFFKGTYDLWVQEDAIVFSGSEERFQNASPAVPIRDKRHALCTCFMMVRPTRASRFLVHRWSRHVRARVMEGGKAVLNQPAFNKALSLTPDREVAVGVLPIMYFPSGYIFFRCGGQPYCKKNWEEREFFWSAVKREKSWPVMVHNNWLEGHDLKLSRFKEYKLWYLK